MIGPSRRLAVAFGLLGLPFVAALWLPAMETVGLILLGAFALLLALDAAAAPRRAALEVEVRVEPVLSLAAEEAIPLRVRSRGGADLRGWARLVLPEEWETPRAIERVSLQGRGEGEIVFRSRPRKRGRYEVGPAYLRLATPLGFFWKDLKFGAVSAVKVYPAVAEIKRYALLSRRLRSREMGLRAYRVRGQGMEFARLRDYRPGDDRRLVDWKATARRGRLVTREYQVERCQNVVLMIDAGRMLTEEVDGIVKIEYVLNAALLLTRVAAEYDDRVGAVVFSDRVDRVSAPRKGRAAVTAMAEALYDVQPKLCEANYEAAFAQLNASFRKRALVVLFTNLVDQGVSELVSAYLKGVAWRHLPVCVAVGDRETRDIAWGMPRTAHELYRKAAAAQLLVSRSRTLQDLQRRGVHVIDAPAGKVPVGLVNKYLELKSRQLL